MFDADRAREIVHEDVDLECPLDGEMPRDAHTPATKDVVFCRTGDPILILLESPRASNCCNFTDFGQLAQLP